jgi:hypothetical protein
LVKVYIKTFAVFIHGVSIAGRARFDPSQITRSIEADNINLYPGLKIKKAFWLRKPNDSKTFASLIIKVNNATLINRIITEGVFL